MQPDESHQIPLTPRYEYAAIYQKIEREVNNKNYSWKTHEILTFKTSDPDIQHSVSFYHTADNAENSKERLECTVFLLNLAGEQGWAPVSMNPPILCRCVLPHISHDSDILALSEIEKEKTDELEEDIKAENDLPDAEKPGGSFI